MAAHVSMEAPPTVAPPPAPTVVPAHRSRSPIVAAGVVIALLVVAVAGYAAGGFVYGNRKVNSAISAYNKVADDQNKMAAFFNNEGSNFNKGTVSAGSVDTVKKDRTALQTLVTQSESFQPTVTSDDAMLAGTETSLKENAWLTVLSKSSIDRQYNNIVIERAALGIAKTILADYIQYGTFYESVDDAIIDVDNMSTALNNEDVQGAITANTALKADLAKAVSLEKAAGVSTQMPGFLAAMQAVANDFSALISAAQSGNSAGLTSALNALDADTAKVDAYDFRSMGSEEQAYFKKLVDSYNAEVDKLKV